MIPNSPAELAPFHAMEILALAKAREARGEDICHLEVGEPSVPPAPSVIAAVAGALSQPQRYTHAKGLPDLRDGLARFYAQRHGAEVDPDSILVTMGSSAGFILAFQTVFAPGARVAITRPGYPAYLNTLIGLGLTPVEIALAEERGWTLSGDDIARAHAQTPFEGLLFASPANPTGATVDRTQFAEIVATCARLGVTLISDEIYHGLEYAAASVSALELTDEAIVINSFSKYHCMTGWRVGWAVMPHPLVRRAEMLAQNFFISAPTLSQIGAIAALGATDYAEKQKSCYARNRLIMAEGLAELGFSLARPGDGAFYCYAGIDRFGADALAFCRRLLEAGVAATPGIDFDRVEGHRFVRFSYAGSQERVREALSRIGRMVRRE